MKCNILYCSIKVSSHKYSAKMFYNNYRTRVLL